jgi:hypothetical protein
MKLKNAVTAGAFATSALLVLSACDTLRAGAPPGPPPPPPVVVCPAPPAPVIVPDPSGAAVNQLLEYQASLRGKNSGDLSRELTELNTKPSSAKNLLRRAMVLTALKGNGDLGRAQVLLDAVLQSDMSDEQALKPLAVALGAQLADSRRQEEVMDRLNTQIRDAGRRNDQLNDKLEALKNIERTLSVRPGAPAPPVK